MTELVVPAHRSYGDRMLRETLRPEALRLLASVPFGRVVFTARALPAVRVVNHIVDRGEVIVRTSEGSQVALLLGQPSGSVVAYEADELDPATRTGWSVVVTGLAMPVTDPDAVSRYENLLRPWVEVPMAGFIRIRPEIITGYHLVDPAV